VRPRNGCEWLGEKIRFAIRLIVGTWCNLAVAAPRASVGATTRHDEPAAVLDFLMATRIASGQSAARRMLFGAAGWRAIA
jgi:hypothetical protein